MTGSRRPKRHPPRLRQRGAALSQRLAEAELEVSGYPLVRGDLDDLMA